MERSAGINFLRNGDRFTTDSEENEVAEKGRGVMHVLMISSYLNFLLRSSMVLAIFRLN